MLCKIDLQILTPSRHMKSPHVCPPSSAGAQQSLVPSSSHHHQQLASRHVRHHHVIISGWQAGVSAIISIFITSGPIIKSSVLQLSAEDAETPRSNNSFNASCRYTHHPSASAVHELWSYWTQEDWIGTAAAYGLTWAAMSDAMMFGSARTSEPGGFHQDCTALVKPSPC